MTLQLVMGDQGQQPRPRSSKKRNRGQGEAEPRAILSPPAGDMQPPDYPTMFRLLAANQVTLMHSKAGALGQTTVGNLGLNNVYELFHLG